MVKTKKNAWHKQPVRHKRASHIGWAFGKGRKKGPKSPTGYMRASGYTKSGIQRHVSGRTTTKKALSQKRQKAGKKRSYNLFGVAVNRKGGYRAHIKSYFKAHPARGVAQARTRMKQAAKAWRSGRGVATPKAGKRRAATNQVWPGTVYYNRPMHKKYKKRKKSGRRNPVLPYAAFNGPVLPRAAFNQRGRAATVGPFDAVKEAFMTTINVDFLKDTVLPMAGGFIGSQFAGGLVYAGLEKVIEAPSPAISSAIRIGSRLIGSAGLSALTFVISKDRGFAGKVLAGGLVSVVVSLIQEIFGKDTYDKMTGVAGFVGDLSQDLTETLQEQIAESVRGEIERAEGGVSGTSAFVSTQDLATSPQLGPGPRVGGMDAFVTTEDLQTAPVSQQYASEAPVVSDLDAFSDAEADMMLV